jgi:chloramphenicol-sensitive protein RarD
MKIMKQSQQNTGIIYTISAYILWGFLPIYWKLVDHVSAGEVLAHRIIWSFVLMIGIVFFTKNWTNFIVECKGIIASKSKLIGISLASIFISLNWLTFIWAVNSGHIVQASLGYYINPLISIVLGVVILKERLTRGQLIALVIAGLAVINLTISFGVFPWIALILAFTFGIYGLLKKTVDVGATAGLTIETMIVTPMAAIYLLVIPKGAFLAESVSLDLTTPLLLIGTGIATATPLLLFAHGAKRIPLALLGFLQYISPTIMLIIGIFIFKETFSTVHLISFALIWISLIIFMRSFQTKRGSTA